MTCPWKTVTSPRRDEWGPWNTGIILSGRQRGRGEESCENPLILAQGHKPESVSQPKTKQARAHGFKFHFRHRSHSPDHTGLQDPVQSRTPPPPWPPRGFPSQEEPRVQLSSARFHTSLGEGVIGEESRELQALELQALTLPTGHTHWNRQPHQTLDSLAGRRPVCSPPKHKVVPVP